MEDGREDIEALIDRELDLLTIGREERVACRNFDYPVVRWSEKELQSRAPTPLLSGDPLSLQGCSVGVEKADVPKVRKLVVPPEEEDIDISEVLKEPAHVSSEKWAEAVGRFKELLHYSEQQEKEISVSIADLKTLELPDCLRHRDEDAEQTQEVQLEDAGSDTHDVLHLSDISDEDERALADGGALTDLRKSFLEEADRLKQEAEEKAKETEQVCEEEFAQHLLKEEKLYTARPAYVPVDLSKVKLMADETLQRDAEFTSSLEAAEARIEEDIAQARKELKQMQDEQNQRKADQMKKAHEEEEERQARQKARLDEMQAESRLQRREERKQFRQLKEASERLKMEATDIESAHALAVLEERKKKEAAVKQARMARLRAEHEERECSEQENLMSEESDMRRIVEKTCTGAVASLKDPFVSLCDHAAKLLQQRCTVITAHAKEVSAIQGEEQQTRAAMLDWVGASLQKWDAEVVAFYKDEDDSRAAIQSHEARGMQAVIADAEVDHCKVEEVLVSIDLAKKKREAFTTCERETSKGAAKLPAMLSRAAKASSATAGPCRLVALRLQTALRAEWLHFSNPNAVTLIRKRKIIPEDAHPAQHKPLPSPHPPVREGAVVLNTEYFRRAYSLGKLEVLDKVSITFEQIVKVAGPFPDLVNLTELDLSNNKITDFSGGVHGLRVLDLTDNSVGCVQFLADLPSLERVKLDSNSINSLAGVGECARLRVLSVRHNYLSDASVLKECTSLTSLDLFGNNLSTLAVPEVSSLTHLNVGRNALKDVSNILRSCTLLMEAHLYNNRIASLPSRIHNVLLQSLLLSDNTLEKIPDLAHLPLLTMLDVSSNRLQDITGVRGCLHLEVLNLAFNELADARAVLSPCRTLQRLQRLDVNDNPFWEADMLGLVKGNLERLLPTLRFLNSTPVDRQQEPPEHISQSEVPRILSMCHPCGRSLGPPPEVYNLASYDELCVAHIRERRRVEGEARRIQQAAYERLEDMALQQVQAHATPGAQHLQHKFRPNPIYEERRARYKRGSAALKICLWFKSQKRLQRKRSAAVRIQATWKGHTTRRRLRENAWEDADKEVYGQVAVDFGDELDTSRFKHMGEILGAALARHGVPAPKEIAAYKGVPTPTPPPGVPEPRTPKEYKEPRAQSMHSMQQVQASERMPVVQGAQTEETPLTGATLAWSSGMQRREKKFEKIKKRRQTEERYLYDRSKTLDSKKTLVTQTIERVAATASVKKHDTPPPPPADLEVESLSSTLSTHKSFKKTMSLPPLNRSLN